ncbi:MULTISPECIES: S8 family serine peptidase [Tenacibaculum]|uniref:S8 family serine peptidase n=1 Tax=Tenacibaculum TaxID=104267 RepID=UPI001F0AFB9D|nr:MULTISPECIES: S8 family serine peptidase [Tenacibaculum]MCH3883292.1 S8 family serine peptidase [Tenacibaculum aquimarinum]MDO6600352.1 S8 family serine peptidase [Tenacibaculum sp. 1_MG-2023]
MKTTKKYIIQLKDDSKSSLSKAAKVLSLKITSSAELSSKVRAQDVLDSGNGLFLKNLGLAIVEDYEVEKLHHLTNTSSNPIIYWEKEREFKPVTELGLLDEMKINLNNISEKIAQLKELIEASNKLNINKNLTWGLNAVGIELSNYTGKGIDIAILDTGFYKDHPDFVGRNISGKSFVPGEKWDLDGHGHGTHCTGTAAGSTSLIDNKRYGVAHEANIVIGKVLSDSGNGSTSGIIDAIDNSLEKGHKIISMSLGSSVKIGEKPSPIFEQVGRKALEKNTLIIAAAGNDSNRPNLPKPVSSPANAESIMAVAALDEALKIANFSNGGINASNGGRVDISAPGVDIFSSYSKNGSQNKLYTTMSGTSMATPHVAGIAALYWEAFPNLSAEGIWLKLEKRAKQLSDQLYRDIGQGIIQAI